MSFFVISPWLVIQEPGP